MGKKSRKKERKPREDEEAVAANLEGLKISSAKENGGDENHGAASTSTSDASMAHGKTTKKEERKAAIEFEKQLMARIHRANFIDWETTRTKPRDFLEEFPMFATLKSGDTLGESMFYTGKAVSSQVQRELYALTERNMKNLYEKGGWTWSEQRKYRDLFDESSRLVVVREKSEESKLIAFIAFRVFLEDHCPVLYVYELQCNHGFTRMGFGKRLMLFVELIAKKYHLEWVMLTVFTDNEPARKFYNAIKYTVDETSPYLEELHGEHAEAYHIYSKQICQ